MTPNHIPALLIIAAFVAAWPAGAATADDHFGPAAERGALFEEFVERFENTVISTKAD